MVFHYSVLRGGNGEGSMINTWRARKMSGVEIFFAWLEGSLLFACGSRERGVVIEWEYGDYGSCGGICDWSCVWVFCLLSGLADAEGGCF